MIYKIDWEINCQSKFILPVIRIVALKRSFKGDLGINLLEKACREHDMAYANTKNLVDRQLVTF